MKWGKFALVVMAALTATSTVGFAQLQERPQIPREWYSEVVLWNYGENRQSDTPTADCAGARTPAHGTTSAGTLRVASPSPSGTKGARRHYAATFQA